METLKKERDDEFKYPTRKSVIAPYTAKKESYDLMPSIKTQAYAKSVKTEQETYANKGVANTRFRVMAAIYILAALVISAIIIGIAVAISSTTGAAVEPSAYEPVAGFVQIFENSSIINPTTILNS
jgi:hypothetical protein